MLTTPTTGIGRGAVTVQVQPADPATWPPIPDQQVIDDWMALPMTAKEAGPVPREVQAGHYISLVLDTRTGHLRPHARDWRTPHTPYNPVIAGFTYQLHTPVPEQLEWVVDSGVKELPHLTAEQATELADRAAPLAQTLLDHLADVPGCEGERDWSATAFCAGLDIWRLVGRDQLPPLGRRTEIIDFADVIATVPELVRAEWADAADAALDDAAAYLTRSTLVRHPRLREQLGIDPATTIGRTEVVGARAWVYAYRAEQNRERPVLDATRWFARPENTLPGRVSPDLDEQGLASFATREQAVATREGIRLVGLEAALRAERDRQRQQVVDRLPDAGAEVKRLEAQLAQARAARAALLGQIISWGDDRYDTGDTDLGRRALMSRQAILTFRQQVTASESEVLS